MTPRARSRLATLAQAISRTRTAEHAVIHIPRRAFCVVGPGCRNIAAKSSTTKCPIRSAAARLPRSCCAITSVSEFIRLQNQRSEDVNVFVVRSQGLRQYADDGDAASVQNNLSACNARVRAKTTTPASVGENHDCVAALGLLLVAEIAAEARLNP